MPLFLYSKIIRVFKDVGIYAALNPNRQGETAYGYMWKYDEGNHADVEQVGYKNRKRIIAINKNTGKMIKEYPSMSKAAKELKVSMNKIRTACNGRDSFDDFILKYSDDINY